MFDALTKPDRLALLLICVTSWSTVWTAVPTVAAPVVTAAVTPPVPMFVDRPAASAVIDIVTAELSVKEMPSVPVTAAIVCPAAVLILATVDARVSVVSIATENEAPPLRSAAWIVRLPAVVMAAVPPLLRPPRLRGSTRRSARMSILAPLVPAVAPP